MTRQDNKPKLRFPEFRGMPEWEEKQVGQLFEVTRGQVLSMTKVSHTQNNITPYPVYSSQTKNNGLTGFYKDFLFENCITWTTDGANAGDVNYRKGKFFCTNVCGVLINREGLANLCIAEIINSVSKQYVSYVGNPKLMNNIMKKITIFVPTLPEQQKIADCLTSLDERISAENNKLTQLKAHKKGLMQKLFPSEGQERPGYRFPEFQCMPEWEEDVLGNICSITTGKLDANAMVKNGKYRFYTCAKDFYLIDNYMFDTEALLISGNGANVGYIHYYKGKFNAYQRTYILDKFNKSIIFIKYFLEQYLKDRISKEKKEGNTPYIVIATLSEMPLLIPSPKEQQKIADCLSALDDLIAAQNEKIAQLKAHKKGLMQQLFV